MDRRQVLYLSAAAIASSCSGAPRLSVGAKNFIEQDILGEILSEHLFRQLHVEPRQRLHLGGSFLAHQALIDGAIDLYPEYSGTALTACLKLPLEKDPALVFSQVKQAYSTRHQVEWGWPLGFSNTFAMVIRREEANRLKIASLTDAVQKKSGWRIGVGYEFEQRPDGWSSFVRTYPLSTSGQLRTMDLGLIYRALASNEVDLVAGNSTDPALTDSRFIALTDDRLFFPPYETCLAVRKDALARHKDLRRALDKLTNAIPVDQMRKWNAQAINERMNPATIAKSFIEQLDR